MTAPDDTPPNPLLVGLVGSHAYGLSHALSDQDHMGIFAYPSERFFGLHVPTKSALSRVSFRPDVTYHELVKYLGLSFACNPSTNELMWLDEKFYTHMTPYGMRLIEMRRDFLSEQRVKDAYYGYCNQQFQRIQRRWERKLDPEDTEEDRKKKVAKHARHLYRLSVSLRSLWRRKTVQVDVTNYRERIFGFGEIVAYTKDTDQGLLHVRALLDDMQTLVDRTPSVLPEYPSETRAEQLLQDVRRFYLDRDSLVDK